MRAFASVTGGTVVVVFGCSLVLFGLPAAFVQHPSLQGADYWLAAAGCLFTPWTGRLAGCGTAMIFTGVVLNLQAAFPPPPRGGGVQDGPRLPVLVAGLVGHRGIPGAAGRRHARHARPRLTPPNVTPIGVAMHQPIHAVCLDAYGTLVRIRERRDPYRSLFRLLGVDPRPAARLAMTADLRLEELARLLAPGHDADLSEVARGLEAEVASVTLFDDVLDALFRLRGRGLKLWVASNLAPPYAVPLRSLLAGLVDGFCFSFEVGAIKPETGFFGELCSRAGCPPALAVMAGDSLRSDVEGAEAFGMRAVHLARDPAAARPGSFRSLAELADVIERNAG